METSFLSPHGRRVPKIVTLSLMSPHRTKSISANTHAYIYISIYIYLNINHFFRGTSFVPRLFLWWHFQGFSNFTWNTQVGYDSFLFSLCFSVPRVHLRHSFSDYQLSGCREQITIEETFPFISYYLLHLPALAMPSWVVVCRNLLMWKGMTGDLR